MKVAQLVLCLAAVCSVVLADVTDPIAAFRQKFYGYPAGEKLIKWECDINGDGHTEVFISAKTNYDRDLANHDVPAWRLYIANAAGTGYVYCDETHEEDATVSYSAVAIDLDAVFVGLISEVNARGLVTIETANPRTGNPIARIYAYTLENGYLKRAKLAEYNPEQSNAIFDKYLKDTKRTVVQPVEVPQ